MFGSMRLGLGLSPTKGGGLSPIPALSEYGWFIEGWADWHGQHTDCPTGVASLPLDSQGLRPLLLTVTGAQGDTTLTGTGFDATNGAGTYGVAIQHDDGTYGIYTASGITTTSITVSPALRAAVTAGPLSSMGGQALDQHYVELPYKALGRHIYNRTRRQSLRRRYIARWTAQTDLMTWTPVGIVVGATGVAASNFAANSGVGSFARQRGNRVMTASGTGADKGLSWTVALGGRTGHLEAFIGIASGPSYRVRVVVDAVELYNQVHTAFQRIIVPFTGGASGTIEVLTGSATTTALRIGDVIWWDYGDATGLDNRLIDKNGVLAFVGDSWGVYYSGVLPNELQQARLDDGGTGTLVISSVGGRTAEAMLAAFDDEVAVHNPNQVVISSFVNDHSSYATTDPNRWLTALGEIALKCRAIGAEPIFVMPLPTLSFSQSTGLGVMAEKIGFGRPV